MCIRDRFKSMLRSFLKAFEDIIYVERFSSLRGVLQGIDPRVKLGSFLIFILTTVALRDITSLFWLSLMVFLLSVLSRIPTKFFFFRTTFFIPIFAAVLASPLPFITPGTSITRIGYDEYFVSVTSEGLYKAGYFIFKVWVCVGFLTLLVLTTRFSALLQALESLRIPKFFIGMTAITYRFVFLFIDEAYRMILAKEARTVSKEGRLKTMKSIASIISNLLIRAYERGERVYLAMKAREHSVETRYKRGMRCKPKDWAFIVSSILFCLTVVIVETYI